MIISLIKFVKASRNCSKENKNKVNKLKEAIRTNELLKNDLKYIKKVMERGNYDR
jgi:hypothetical protein